MLEQAELFRIGLNIYAELCLWSIPIAFAFGMGNVIVNTFLSVGFGGRLKIGGR